MILDRREARAAAKRTAFGRQVQSTLWTGHEYETLRLLYSAGADVPEPLGRSPSAVLMEWIGYQSERLVAIDFPQAIDPRFNSRAYELLARDLDHVCRFFARFGVESEPGALAADLWDRFTRGVLT